MSRKRSDRTWGHEPVVLDQRDDPKTRFLSARVNFRCKDNVTVRPWEADAIECGPLQCLLCNPQQDFYHRQAWLAHVESEHGGLQRYRNAWLSHMQLRPYTVSGQELG